MIAQIRDPTLKDLDLNFRAEGLVKQKLLHLQLKLELLLFGERLAGHLDVLLRVERFGRGCVCVSVKRDFGSAKGLDLVAEYK